MRHSKQGDSDGTDTNGRLRTAESREQVEDSWKDGGDGGLLQIWRFKINFQRGYIL